jgi:dihydrofolate reductase
MARSSVPFTIIVACTEKTRGIGFKGRIPWVSSEDLRHFRKTTIGQTTTARNAVVMGRVTWESLPFERRPLIARKNVVVSTTMQDNPWCTVRTGLDEALDDCEDCAEVFVIGGQMLYEEAIKHPACTRIIVTLVDLDTECDRFFPEIDEGVWNTDSVRELSAHAVTEHENPAVKVAVFKP